MKKKIIFFRVRAGLRHVDAPGRLIIWRPFKPMFFKCLFNTIIEIYSSDVLPPLIAWPPGQLTGWLVP
jgi:hypothetical protein